MIVKESITFLADAYVLRRLRLAVLYVRARAYLLIRLSTDTEIPLITDLPPFLGLINTALHVHAYDP